MVYSTISLDILTMLKSLKFIYHPPFINSTHFISWSPTWEQSAHVLRLFHILNIKNDIIIFHVTAFNTCTSTTLIPYISHLYFHHIFPLVSTISYLCMHNHTHSFYIALPHKEHIQNHCTFPQHGQKPNRLSPYQENRSHFVLNLIFK